MKDIIDSHYKPDLEIADRYINFSSELLRLSLLAITGIGALILANFKEDSGFHLTLGNKYCFLISILLFAAAAAF